MPYRLKGGAYVSFETHNFCSEENEFFRCRKCEYYIKDFTYCPCCGTRLAIAPRNAKSKRELLKDIVRY